MRKHRYTIPYKTTYDQLNDPFLNINLKIYAEKRKYDLFG